MITRNPRLTAAGLALFTNQAAGFSVAVTHVAIGTSVYDPTGTETALKTETARFPVASGTTISPSQIQLGALITNTDPSGKSPNNKYVGEIGFFVGSTLLAVLSQSSGALFYKSPDLDVPISYVLDFSTLPPGSLTVNAQGLSDSLQLAAQTAKSQADAARNAVADTNAAKDSAISTINSTRDSAVTTVNNTLKTITSTYYGTYSADPAARPDGTAMQKGDRYFNATSNAEKTWNGSAWYIPNVGASDLAAAGGAALVGFQQAGTGAVTRTAQDRLRDVVSVKDFGAKGDGVTDDTAAIQAAADATKYPANKNLFFPSGKYKTTAPLRIGQHAVWIGEQAVDGGSEIWFYGGSTANAIQSDGDDSIEKSRVQIMGLRALDKRTGATAGWGVYLANVDNRTNIDACYFGQFPTGQIYVGAPAGKACDCVEIRNTWISSTLVDGAKGILVERADNVVKIEQIYADVKNGIAITVQNIMNDGAIVEINSIKHEAINPAYSASYATIQIAQGHGNLVIDGVVQRNSSGSGCDVVQFLDSSSSRAQLRNITGAQHLTAGVAPYVVNILSPFAQTFNVRVDQMYIGTSGRAYRVLGGNGTPEGIVVGWVGELFHRLDGGASSAVYFKSSGAGTSAGWLPLCGYLSGAATVDVPSIASGASYAFDITVTGAAVGNFAVVAFGGSGGTLMWSAQVTAADTVKVICANLTGVALDPSSQTINVRVFK